MYLPIISRVSQVYLPQSPPYLPPQEVTNFAGLSADVTSNPHRKPHPLHPHASRAACAIALRRTATAAAPLLATLHLRLRYLLQRLLLHASGALDTDDGLDHG